MLLKINPELKNFFPATEEKQLFAAIMAISGKSYRATGRRETLRFVKNGRAYFIKKHFGVGWREIGKNLLYLRLPILGAKSEYQAVKLLNKLNVPTMKVVGFGERNFNPAKKQSFIITEELTDVYNLENICYCWRQNPPEFNFKRKIISAVAHVARTIHQHGLNHRDFYVCHFYVAKSSVQEEKIVLYLMDLHRAQIRKKVPSRWLIKDIAGLYFSVMDYGITQRDILRFLRDYFAQPLRNILSKEKRFLRRVEYKAMKLYKKTKIN